MDARTAIAKDLLVAMINEVEPTQDHLQSWTGLLLGKAESESPYDTGQEILLARAAVHLADCLLDALARPKSSVPLPDAFEGAVGLLGPQTQQE